MEGILLFAIAEMVAVTTLKTMQIHAQNKLIEKWEKGQLTSQELLLLKSRPWFQRRVIKPPKNIVSLSKKNN